MIASAASPANGQPKSKQKRRRRSWQPDARDHLIYQLVKFDGMKQVHAAADFGISQATVSRIIDRYERWQAHADPREGGRLDPAERRRAQRWLTYERNERILASALRIADRMEGVTESRKTIRTKPLSEWHKEGTEIRSEEQSVDQHGVAARFLRLAFRVNMEQLKLVEQDPPPLPEPLTASELAEEERRDAAVEEEIRVRQQREAESAAAEQEQIARAEAPLAGTTPGPGEAAQDVPPPLGSPQPAGAPDKDHARGDANAAVLREQVCSRLEAGAEHNVHNVHTGTCENIAATNGRCTCAAETPATKNAAESCIAELDADGQRGNLAGESDASNRWRANEFLELA
jgi:transposase